jgi:uncharacterized protein (TIGR00730 family)
MTAVKRLCVYCGASNGVDEVYREAAARLGQILGQAGVELIYGGGRVGLMGLLADATLTAGGRVTGIIPSHLDNAEIGHRSVSDLIVVGSMHERKQRMFELADAFAVLPGGLGTLDEAFEIITWRQLGLHDKPIIVIDVAGYWAPLMTLFEHVIAQGFARDKDRNLAQLVASVEDVLPALAGTHRPTKPAEPGLV